MRWSLPALKAVDLKCRLEFMRDHWSCMTARASAQARCSGSLNCPATVLGMAARQVPIAAMAATSLSARGAFCLLTGWNLVGACRSTYTATRYRISGYCRAILHRLCVWHRPRLAVSIPPTRKIGCWCNLRMCLNFSPIRCWPLRTAISMTMSGSPHYRLAGQCWPISGPGRSCRGAAH